MSITIIDKPRKIRRVITFDLEWIPGEQIPDGPCCDVVTHKLVSHLHTTPLQLRVAGVFDGKTFRSYPTVGAFLEHELTRKNRGAWFYAHAGGLADISFVFDEIIRWNASQCDDRRCYKVKASFSGSSAIIVHVLKGKASWHFVDSYWLLRDKLANIGKAINLPKLEEEKRTTRAETVAYYRDTPIDQLIRYNERDCVILWQAISNFETVLLQAGGQLQMTIAGSAMHLFRRKYLSRSIETSPFINEAAGLAYTASRVEVFDTYATDFSIYDINSSFPHAMTFPCPGPLKRTGKTIPDNADESCIYLAHIDLEVPDMYLPPIPYRLKGRVFFPTGKWTAWLDSTDVRLLVRKGGKIHKVHTVHEFEPTMDLKGYATDIYRMRKESETPFGRLVMKLLMNSLYGKFAESPHKSAILINPQKIDRDKSTMLLPGVWQLEQQVPVAHRHVPLSVHITAIARRTLYEFMERCEEQHCPVHYCDTDSVATPALLPTSNELGGLKLEKKMSRAHFRAPKVYQGEGLEQDKTGEWKPVLLNKAKGFSLPSDPKEAAAKLDAVIEGGEIQFQRMARLREIYRLGDTSPIEVMVRKALTGLMVSKRFHYPDGSTRPWCVDELLSGDRNVDFESTGQQWVEDVKYLQSRLRTP